MSQSTLPKKKLQALEKVFAAEIDGRLPFQANARIYKSLCDDGLLVSVQRVFESPAFPVTISGYQLTHAGRFAYCSSCKDEPDA